MKHAFIFPGQGSQFPGMGKDIYSSSPKGKERFEQANEILGFRISDILFEGSAEDLRQTEVTQPAIFLHSVIRWETTEELVPDMVAGHSLGEFSALVANQVLSFEEGLKLVARRARAMQKACALQPSTMAAILGLSDEQVEAVLAEEKEEVVVAANYNCPGQLVISGTLKGVEEACQRLKEAGARRALILPVGGAFHSPLMAPAAEELKEAILRTRFSSPLCPIYQNVNAQAQTDPDQIRQHLIDQLTAPVRWTQTIERMVAAGARQFTEVGPGQVLQGLVKKIAGEAVVTEGLG